MALSACLIYWISALILFKPSLSPPPLGVYPTITSSLYRMATFKTFVISISLVLSLIQAVNASAVKRWGVPLPACTPATPFVYAGCFSDTGSTDALEYRTELDYNNMTIEACVDFCKGNYYLHSRFWLRTPLTRSRKRLQICRP